MTNENRYKAILELTKSAQTEEERIAANAAKFAGETPEQRKQRLEEYKRQRAERARNTKIKPAASPWSLKSLRAATNGFVENLAEDGAANLWSGTKSFLNGVGTGLSRVPGDIVGLGAGAVGLVTGGVEGAKNYYRASSDAVNRYTGIDKFQNYLNAEQQRNMNEYMKRNNIDPNDTLAMAGMHIANGAGSALGETVGFNKFKLFSPIKTVKGFAHGATVGAYNSAKNIAKAPVQLLRGAKMSPMFKLKALAAGGLTYGGAAMSKARNDEYQQMWNPNMNNSSAATPNSQGGTTGFGNYGNSYANSNGGNLGYGHGYGTGYGNLDNRFSAIANSNGFNPYNNYDFASAINS